MTPARAPDGPSREPRLSHVDERGAPRMVDVSGKDVSVRRAVAEGMVRMRAETRRSIEEGAVEKGSVLDVARIAGIQGAKRTWDLIPLCHPLPLDRVAVAFEWIPAEDESEARLRIEASVTVSARTGVEMEALTAVSVAALTVYDMIKAVDRAVTIDGIRLLEKTGGKSGSWRRV